MAKSSIVYVTTSTCAACGKALSDAHLSVVGRSVVVPCCETDDLACRDAAWRIWEATVASRG